LCINGCFILENQLEELLKNKLAGTKSHLEELFQFNGPLGTFSSKIKISYSLGFISKSIMNDLDLIRKIRNEFGHEYKPIEFETPKIKNRISNLKEHFFDKEDNIRSRFIFTNTVLGILAQIHSANNFIVKINEKEHKSMPSEQRKKIKEQAIKSTDELIN
jgi:hypothetical protein